MTTAGNVKFPGVKLRHGGDLDTWIMVFEMFALQQGVLKHDMARLPPPSSVSQTALNREDKRAADTAAGVLGDVSPEVEEWNKKVLLGQVLLFTSIDTNVATAIHSTLPTNPLEHTSHSIYQSILHSF